MPFRIASGPEEYQQRQHEFLDSLRGVINITDDICLYGCGNTEEDADSDSDHVRLTQLNVSSPQQPRYAIMTHTSQ